MPGRFRLGVGVFAAAALALGVLGPASAGRQTAGKYGGTLVVGLGSGDPATLDPAVSRDASAATIYPSFCQSLYERDARLQLIPVLAAAVPAISKDKLTYTIALRRGIEFNDGTPFNAQAVVASVRRYMGDPGSPRGATYASVDSVTAPGQYTVVFHLSSRDSTFTGDNPVMSPTQLAKLGDNFGTNPVCVGPFMFDETFVVLEGRLSLHLPGSSVELGPASRSSPPAASRTSTGSSPSRRGGSGSGTRPGSPTSSARRATRRRTTASRRSGSPTSSASAPLPRGRGSSCLGPPGSMP